VHSCRNLQLVCRSCSDTLQLRVSFSTTGSHLAELYYSRVNNPRLKLSVDFGRFLHPGMLQRTDSRVTSYKIKFDNPEVKPDGTEWPKECILKNEIKSKDPILIKVEHLNPLVALRKTLFHSEEIVTDVRLLNVISSNIQCSTEEIAIPSLNLIDSTTGDHQAMLLVEQRL